MVQNLDPVAGAECFMRYAEDSWRWRTASAVSASDAPDAAAGVADPADGAGLHRMEMPLCAVLEEKTALLKEVRRLTELYATLSHINQAIVWNSARQDLLDEICQVTAHYAGFQLACSPAGSTLRPNTSGPSPGLAWRRTI
ncbi:MAG: hypothetical protein U5O69_03010 [Candidatus Competibacteraceae bacterium]|nr:hypothetical protein [Candidatus Competibacteraceae bacterium]